MSGEAVYQRGARDLCTIEGVVRLVPGYDVGDDTDTDLTLGSLITTESLDFQEATGAEITPKDPALLARPFDLNEFDVHERELLIGDASTVTGVAIAMQDGTPVQTLTSASWVALERIREVWEPITSLRFPTLVATPALLRLGDVVTVTGTWGFPAIPTTVRAAIERMVIVRYLNDVAAEGTAFSNAANQTDFNIAAALKLSFDARRRFAVRALRTA